VSFFCAKFFFGAKISNPKVSFVQNFGAQNLLFYEKGARKMLVKLTPGREDFPKRESTKIDVRN